MGTGVLLVGLVVHGDDQPKENSILSAREGFGRVETSKPSRIHVGGTFLTGGYGRFSGSGYWGAPLYGYYGSPFWTPFWQSYFPYDGSGFSNFYPTYNFQRGPNMGEIRLQADPAKASVFINDAYAGSSEDLRSISLEPGVYHLRIEAEGRPAFARRIYVLSGKTLKIEANLQAVQGEQQP